MLLLRGESFFDKADTVSVKEHETSAATDLKKQNHEHNQLIIANQNAIGQTTYLLNENVSKSCTIKEKLPVIHEASETISMSAEESKVRVKT